MRATLLRAVRTVLAGLLVLVRVSRRILAWLIVSLIGNWQWQAPVWLTWAETQRARGWRYLAASPTRAALLALVVVLAGGGYFWYASRPKPHYVTSRRARPGADRIQRQRHRLDQADEDRLQRIGRAAEADAESGDRRHRRSPAIAGTWFWTSDKELQFTPKNDWPVDGAFSVRLADKGLLANQVELEEYSFKFRSQPFSASISESQFYQDPRDPNLKKLVATVTFSHPVDAEQFEPRVSLAVAKDAEYLGLTPTAAISRWSTTSSSSRPTSIRRRWPCRATTRR